MNWKTILLLAAVIALTFTVGLGVTTKRAGPKVASTVLRTVDQVWSQKAYAATDPTLTDTDNDGCTDAEERGTDHNLGGQRDPNNALDFYDLDGNGVINVADILMEIGHYAARSGDPNYDLGYDRGLIGPNLWNLGPGDGVVNVSDILLIVRQYGNRCHGVPAPTVAQVCSELQGEAQAAGFTSPNDFVCSGDPLPQNVSLAGSQMQKRQIQVTIRPDKTAIVTGMDLQMTALTTSPEAAGFTQPAVIPPGAAGQVTGPLACLTEVCHVTLTNRAEIRHLWGHGPNCAWMSYKQEYDDYYPWRVITNVRNPVVQSGASFPCDEDDRTTSIDRSNLPFSAESCVDIKWKAGIPTPWGTIGVRSFHPEICAFFEGNYNVDWS